MTRVRFFAIGFSMAVVFFYGAEKAFAMIGTTPSSGAPAFLLSNTAAVAFDNTSWVELISPDGTDCKINDNGFNGFNTVNVGSLTSMDTNYIPNHSSCGSAIGDNSYVSASFWGTDGTFTWNEYVDQAMTVLVDTGTFTQGTPPSPPGPRYEYGGATSTIEQTQTNLFYAFVLFYFGMFGMIWLIRKH